MDIELVIKLPEEMYKKCKWKNNGVVGLEWWERAIANGTPLPKGHGRILDEKDILDTENNDGGWYDLTDMPEYIAGIKAIIEEDKNERYHKQLNKNL